jgi:hypothetical protein
MNENLNSKDEQEIVSIFKAFTNVDFRSASWVCAAMAMFMQYAGIDFVIVYATVLISKLDKVDAKSAISPGLSSMIIGVFAFIGPILSIYIFQKAGRKSIIIAGFFGCLVMHLGTAISYE